MSCSFPCKLFFSGVRVELAGVSISTDGRRNASATFFQKKEATSLNSVVNKKYIIKSERKCNYDVL